MYEPLIKKVPHFLHGADYNPDQWMETKEIWDEDVRLMKTCYANVMSVGIFSWHKLEPEEGVYTFEWLDEIMDKLYANGVYVILATPSGARPRWLSDKYEEVLRVEQDGKRIHHMGRHNHCYTSPIYREKVQKINEQLALRYKDHPALIAWHVSNEYGGECHCDLCQAEFRGYVKNKYKTIENLNQQWWAHFWSNGYSSWDQIRSDNYVIHGLELDWKRFVTHQTIDFFKAEIEPLKRITPDIPVTANFMGIYPGLDYFKFGEVVDFASWDSYPTWHNNDNIKTAALAAFQHDLTRMIKGGQPFMLMESTPSTTNWLQVSKLKKPGVHLLSSMQAIAHGADTVQYFQWRKSRGSCEKFHGAVVDHVGHENTRVFRDVTQVGKALTKLDDIIGTETKAEVALIYDWENFWAFDAAKGFDNWDKGYADTAIKHYMALWKQGVNIDVIDESFDFDKYKVLIAPILYMLKPGVAKRIKKFVENGGTLITTYISGYVNENDLCFLGGFPGEELRQVTGIWAEEIEVLYPEEETKCDMSVKMDGFKDSYKVRKYCELIHAEGEQVEVLARYAEDFYKDMPCLTKNSFGKGAAYHIAFEDTGDFINDFYVYLKNELDLYSALKEKTGEGVSIKSRSDGEHEYIFAMNFGENEEKVVLSKGGVDLLTGQEVPNEFTLARYEVKIIKS